MAAKRGDETRVYTLKMTGEERDLLSKNVEARAQELLETTGERIEVTVASYLRWLIVQDGQRRGFVKPMARPAPPATERSRARRK